ncbi:FAD-binding oxidoreductase [Aspergillus homomorphus CBS 101889]|uniref:D-lactate dehydrogenase (cytochrome) n=1 Tax=Aspergillus homomorphus (strain CBS 101889) TaxID=1450537 RepID=A0A395HT79_ASPHC|nr:oxidoreductase, FAD-binding protein [Aspergillus homomorphus CBS 101889]RAL10613.1 oxidoreductase, FAD-binding protein [Aspergillus homomorphus CBS 101889]
MRVLVQLPRAFPASPRIGVARCRFGSAHRLLLSQYRTVRLNSTRLEDQVESASNSGDTGSSSGKSSSFGSFSSTVLFSALAAGAGYAYAVTTNQSESGKSNQPQYGTAKDFEKAIAELRASLGDDALSTDEGDLQVHGFSEWSSINADRLPVAIAYPNSTEDVSKIAKICHKYRMPMVPYSGGSSLEANFSAPHGGLTIDFASMNRILELHEADMDVVVQPSIQWMDLNENIKDSGLFFPVDPGPSAMIGGMVGTNCSGTNAMRYGTMKDWVINLTVVLADGRIIKTRRRPRKTSAGYNLTGMFVGSEGTLGIVTEATLKLAPIPEQTRVGVVTFPTVRDAASTAMQLIRQGIQVQCMEILDEVQMDVINRAGGTGRTWKTSPTLFFKFSGTKAGVADSINLTSKLAKRNKADSFEFARDEREAHDLWSARKQSLWSMLSLREKGSEVWSTDVSVPISRLPDIIVSLTCIPEISKKELDNLGLFASILGHIGDGNFHASIMYDRSDPKELERVEEVVYDMVDRALEMEGSCTGEHGVGLGKKGSLVKELGPDTIDVMRSIKQSLDPHWLLNPGKIFDFERKA